MQFDSMLTKVTHMIGRLLISATFVCLGCQGNVPNGEVQKQNVATPTHGSRSASSSEILNAYLQVADKRQDVISEIGIAWDDLNNIHFSPIPAGWVDWGYGIQSEGKINETWGFLSIRHLRGDYESIWRFATKEGTNRPELLYAHIPDNVNRDGNIRVFYRQLAKSSLDVFEERYFHLPKSDDWIVVELEVSDSGMEWKVDEMARMFDRCLPLVNGICKQINDLPPVSKNDPFQPNPVQILDSLKISAPD